MIDESVLTEKIMNKSAIIGVVGLGYVGLPLAVESAKSGYKVIGFDIQEKKVDMVNQGVNYIGDIGDIELKELVERHSLKAVTDFSFVKDVDIVLICVPTPLDKYQQPDISYVRKSTEDISRFLHEGMMIILESTTYPGTTEELLLPILESESKLKCEKDFYLAFSPERVDPGNSIYNTRNTPKIVGGVGECSTKMAIKFYERIIESYVFGVSSPKVAEMEKILENTYRNINIGLINEMTIICNKMGIDVWEVIEAAKSKPYGFQAFYPGPGLGGHCIPLDPYYLTWKAREYDYHTRLIETAGEINNYMPQYIVERSAQILNKVNKPLNNSYLLVLGVAYKNDIDDYRESPAIKVIEKFKKQGARVEFYDPYIPKYIYNGIEYKGIDLTKEALNTADLVVITTDHRKYDYEFIQENSKLIFDTRNATRNLKDRRGIEVL